MILALFLVSHAISQLPSLKVSDNNRFLVTETGSPFFYLGDTGWEMIHRLNRDEISYYLRNRAAKGFNVIQVVLLGEINGVTVPNAEGHLPFTNLDPTEPNDSFFSLVDFALDEAEKLGLYLAILPTWGSHVEDKRHPLFDNLSLFTPENARSFGAFLGNRWQDRRNLIWVLGGDRAPTGYEDVWKALADGITSSDGGQLMSYHIYGGRSSSEVFHHESWLDFNMVQSGHMHPFSPNYDLINHDYNLEPVKPVLDAEPAYEGINIGFSEAAPRFGPFDVRRQAYWSVFAGGFGYTYGHNCIWQMYDTGREPIINAHMPWHEAIHAKGSYQVIHLKNLMLSRPYLNRIPAQDILLSSGESWPAEGTGANHVIATRDILPNGKSSYIMVYYPYPYRVNVKTDILDGSEIQGWWYDPRTGMAFDIGVVENKGTFSVPWNNRLRAGMGGPDWVLILEDPRQNFSKPGQVVRE